MGEFISRRRAILLAACASLLSPVVARAADDRPASAATDAGSDIVVTARRVEERLQDVPISIAVFNQQQLASRNIVTASDLATYTPSLTANTRFGPDRSSFVLRGFVQEQYTSPSVGVYFADVIAQRAGSTQTVGDGAGPGAFFDLQNVQVLKGPQGTLFGRNTTGGNVLLVPQKPTENLEGYAEASAGNFGMWRGQGAINVPLSDTFRARFSLDRQKRDGYIRNRSGMGPKDFNDVDYTSFRLSLVGDLTPNLENYTIASYSESDTHGSAPILTTCNRPLAAASPVVANACAQIDRRTTGNFGRWDTEVGTPLSFLRIRQWQVINTTTWRVSDALTIKNIASYGEFQEGSSYSLSGDNFTIAGAPFQIVHLYTNPNNGHTRQRNMTEELQFQGKTLDGRLTWQAGGYMELSNPPSFNDVYSAIFLSCTNAVLLQCTSPFGPGGSLGSIRTHFNYNSKALYAQATYALTDRLNLTGGFRYTADKITVHDQSTRFRFIAPNVATRACDDIITFHNADGSPLAVTDPATCDQRFQQKSKRPTWLVSLDYKPSDQAMVYAKYSRGYRQGGIAPTNVGAETWQPETVDTYELGAKLDFRGGDLHGHFNIAGFYNDFRDQQIAAILLAKPNSGVIGGQAIVNAGSSTIKGIEIDASATAWDIVKVDLAYTWLDAKLKSIAPPPLDTTGPFSGFSFASEEGDTLAYSPKNRLTVTGTVMLPMDEAKLGALSAGLTYVYTGKQIGSKDSAIGTLPASNLLNANIDWRGALGSPVDLSLFVTNLTNKFYRVANINFYAAIGYDSVIPSLPRMWGLRLRYRFGR